MGDPKGSLAESAPDFIWGHISLVERRMLLEQAFPSGGVVYRCPWCKKGFVHLSGGQPENAFVLNVKCSQGKCGKPYRIVFPEGRVEKSVPIPHQNLVA